MCVSVNKSSVVEVGFKVIIATFLVITIYLYFFLFLRSATSDSVSIIALYFGSIMVMVAFSVVMTVVVLNFHHRSTETKEMGYWVSANRFCNKNFC